MQFIVWAFILGLFALLVWAGCDKQPSPAKEFNIKSGSWVMGVIKIVAKALGVT